MKHASLFSGIGGFDLASEWMGWENVMQCEIDGFCQKILQYYWPKATLYEDIKATDFRVWRGKIDILTGGFPCQPYSTAGKRKGTEDDRHLWPEMLRAIREIKPQWVVGENVSGLVSWNGGLVFEEVQSDLEAEGYEVLPILLPACGLDAPHKRERVWFMAYTKGISRTSSNRYDRERKSCEIQERGFNEFEYAANPNSQRRCSRHSERENAKHVDSRSQAFGFKNNWGRWPTQPPVCIGNDGFSLQLDGITFPKWRNESIKGYGNAVVPQVVYQIFKTIEQYEQNQTKNNRPPL